MVSTHPPDIEHPSNIDSLSDDELMAEVQGGHAWALTELVQRHYGRLWRIAWRFTGNMQSAQDLVQDTFVQVIRAAPDYRGQGRFHAFLRRILANLSMNQQRHDRWLSFSSSTDELSGNDHASGPTPETLVASMEDTHRLDRALSAIHPRQRMAILLRYDEEMSYDEISEAMGVTIKTVERLLARGREKLRGILAVKGTDRSSN
jgi:RNA polymerase sigma-70 factor (ECF subfamily)